jgi:hypothetical protein
MSVPLEAKVIRPFASTVMFAFVYEPAVTAVLASEIVPLVVITQQLVVENVIVELVTVQQ